MIIVGQSVCPRCELEAETSKEDEQFRNEISERKKRNKYNVLASKSVVPDESIKLARFDNYHELGDEERVNKQKAWQLVERLKKGYGNAFTSVLNDQKNSFVNIGGAIINKHIILSIVPVDAELQE